ncbi:hypothetical protein HZQ94_14830 [Elizabethkingia anophelis]|nr:hypothetical protein [Elizabethkingia anophelis]MCT3682059.1 hypothetical protein [Elizabethkingia anophelis]
MEAKELRLSLKKKWFEMTKSKIKSEDYRDINDYWIKRLVDKNFSWDCNSIEKIKLHLSACPNGFFKKFDINTMTLGYPKSDDKERILKLEHKGIEIRTGNPEWGAEPGKLYFVIKHGKILEG